MVLAVKNPAANAEELRDTGSVPGLGRSPAGGHGNPTQYACLENPDGQKSLEDHSARGHKESDMTERLSTSCCFEDGGQENGAEWGSPRGVSRSCCHGAPLPSPH